MFKTNRIASWVFLLGQLVLGCTDSSEEIVIPYEGYVSGTYQIDEMWLCKPGIQPNYCDGDIDATEVLADGTFAQVPHQPSSDLQVDCFYIYPTVDLDTYPGNHTDFSDIEPILDPLLSQAARLNSLCEIYAPLYRQATLGCYLSEGNDQYFDLAYRDVLEAFMHYMANLNQGRDVVIMGHSQGSMMLIRLLQNEFDSMEILRDRLVVALMIGRDVFVPAGQDSGGTFQNIPICRSEGDTGCVVTFSTFAREFPPEQAGSQYPAPYEGMQNVCTNPGALAGGKTALATYFPRHSQFADLPLPEEVAEPFGLYRDFFYGQCVANQHGFNYLEITVEPAQGDPRTNPTNFEEMSNVGSIFGTEHEMGLHLLDYNLPLGNLIEMVRSQIENRN